jgi:signal transduction histidine kinase
MKIFYSFILFLFLSAGKIFSQDTSVKVFHLGPLNTQGIILDKEWMFYSDDNGDYGRVDYNPKDGVPVNPTLLLDQLPVVKRSGIGWFRLKLQVDFSLRNKTVGITLSMLGAAEIYLNGERVYQFGNVSTNYSDERTQALYMSALNLKLGNSEKQLLAVRYSYHPDNMYLKVGAIPNCFRVIMYPPNENTVYYALSVKRTYLFIGIILTIEFTSAFLTLFFFFSFSSRKEYLYYGLYFALQFLGMFVLGDFWGAGKSVQPSANEFMLTEFMGTSLATLASLFYLNGVYVLLQLSKTRFYWFLLWYAIISIAAVPFLPAWGGVFPSLFFVLTCIEILPVYYKAARRGFRRAWMLFGSILICLLGLVVLTKAIIENDADTTIMSLTFTVLTPALGLVIFLALDFANISLSLQSRIVEVEELSKKTLVQEKEKQEILASQNETLEQQVTQRTSELKQSLEELKSTQSQLIQSEKMASLGELTAGIAHEIQNPLNFVNNFSEVSRELIDELKSQKSKLKSEEQDEILNDIDANLEKINHHGKRADSIVKGMLQHSRTSSGQKEPTDINALCDEYLRLAYHGLRAKDKTFNAKFETDFDPSLPKINIVQQDMGRVILNLINNAFYAAPLPSRGRFPDSESNKTPTVWVSTKKDNSKVLISVKDNGTGIPSNIIDKIFQPFFTTKPTGQGTGLGLSLSYDIIKAHGGEIKVNTKEGAGSEFVIRLPAI